MAVILYVNSTAVHGGAEEALLDMMRAAATIGHRPVLVVPRPGWLTVEAQRAGIPVEPVASLPEAMETDRWTGQFVPIVPTALAIARTARRHGAALVHSNTPRTSYHGGLGARLAGRRAVTHCYDIVGTPYRSPWKAALLDRMADWTLTVSDATGAAILTSAPRFAGRISTLYCGFDAVARAGVAPIDLAREFGIPPGAPVMGCAAAMTPWKGQDVLVEAFHRMTAAGSDARLVIIGGSQGSARQAAFESRLRARVTELKLDDRITFAGWREDWRALVGGLDVFVHVPTAADPLPLVVLHAAGLGRAVVATPTGGIPEILGTDGEAGVLVPPGEVNLLADALTALLADPERRERLGSRARERMGRFSPAAMTERLAVVYERLLHG